MRTTLSLTLVCLTILALPRVAAPCSRTTPISVVEMLQDAEAIVRASAGAYYQPPDDRRSQIGGPAGTIRFTVLEVIRGTDLPDPLILPGTLTDRDDFNDQPSPYGFVRPDGRRGSCSASSYRTGAQFLLVLKKNRSGALTPDWYALGPTNEQLHADDDPWLLWVRQQVKAHALSSSAAATLAAAASELFEPKSEWTTLGRGYQLTADSTVDKDGNVFFTDAHANRIMKVDGEGAISVWKTDTHGSHGIAFGPDGRFYVGQHEPGRIVAFSSDGTESVIAEGMRTHHLIVTAHNRVYFAEGPTHQVSMVDTTGRTRVVFGGLDWPHGLCVSADQSRLVINDSHIRSVWSFQIGLDGSLTNGKPLYRLESGDGSPDMDAGGMTFDADGFLYVATKLGVQVCDKQGRVTAIIKSPSSEQINAVFFGGPGLRWLYVTDGINIYRRLAARRGVASWKARVID